MKKIAVLIDYSEGCKKSLQQARILSELTGASIHAVYVAMDVEVDVEDLMLSAFVTENIGTAIPITTHVLDGALLQSLSIGLNAIHPDLIVLCTHGVQGIVQHLFGARVLKLVQSVPCSFVVVQENSVIDEKGFQRILFPATHREDADLLIDRVMNVAAECDSEVVFYEIEKYFAGAEADIKNNFEKAKKLFDSRGIRFSHVKEQQNNHSLGYARQILDYADSNGIGLIATLSQVVETGTLLMKSDKEALITNARGIPILSCG